MTRPAVAASCALCNYVAAPQAFVFMTSERTTRRCRYPVKCARRQLEQDAERKAAAAQ